MTAVRPSPRFNIIRKSTKARLLKRTCRKVSTHSLNGVVSIDVSEQSNKESVDAGFCGEPFADNGELLSSLSSLLFNMKLFGLYFHREDPHQQRTDDPEWNPATTLTRSSSSWLRIYATVILILVWSNAVRLLSLFDKSDHFGAVLLMKMMVILWFSLTAIMYTAYYFASHTGKLFKVLQTLPLSPDRVRYVRRLSVTLTASMWISAVIHLSVLAYIHFTTTGEYDFTVAPLVTYIYVPEDRITIARLCGYVTYIFIFPGMLLCHAMNLVIVYVVCREYKKLKKDFRRAVGESGQFTGDLPSFRRRHQTLSRAVGKMDGFLMFSNVGGFVCHIAIIIILIYCIVFYRESTATPVSALAHIFWLSANIKGLFFSASACIMVNHTVCKRCAVLHCLRKSNRV